MFFCKTLAKVPALLCRLGHVPYDCAVSTLTSGCIPYPILKSLTKEKDDFIQSQMWTIGHTSWMYNLLSTPHIINVVEEI